MLKFSAAYLALAGAAFGAVLVGVVIWTQTSPQSPAPLSGAPAPEAAAPTAPAPAETAPSAPATETAKPDAKSARPKPAAEMAVPSFDLLRVEPDGSTVIAGKGEPNSKLDILNGDTVIATADIGPSGDFAAVLDTPLAAGDHQLTLRAAGPDGAAVASEEVATVSIPTEGGTGLLAMVTKPGEASRILTQPEAPAAPQAAAAAPQAQTPTAPQTETPAAPQAEGPAAAQAESPAAPAATAESPSDAPAAPQETTSAAGAVMLPDLPTAALDMAGNAPAAPAAAPASEQVASAPSMPETPEPAVDAAVRVDAVEIEGDKLFVAGSATPRFSVRVLADGIEVGTAKASQAGRFIVEAVASLAVGDHTITAELIEPGSANVVQRATVPFNRPEGAAMAAVAGAPAAAPATTPQPPVEAPAAPSAAQAPAAPEPSRPAAPEPAAPATAGPTAAPDPATAPSGGTAPAPAVDAAPQAGVAPAAEAPEGIADAAPGPVTIQQEPLTPAAGSVIIRRGDTLWQISRRTYGQGVRYTTIYLANQQQIGNPDRIAPGQIFSVPETPIDNAEEMHRKLLDDRKSKARD